jgi:hypothetical protein
LGVKFFDIDNRPNQNKYPMLATIHDAFSAGQGSIINSPVKDKYLEWDLEEFGVNLNTMIHQHTMLLPKLCQ